MFKWLFNKKNKGEKKMANLEEVRKLYDELSEEDKTKFEQSLSNKEIEEEVETEEVKTEEVETTDTQEKVEETEEKGTESVKENEGNFKELLSQVMSEIKSIKEDLVTLKKSPQEADKKTSKDLNELQVKYEN